MYGKLPWFRHLALVMVLDWFLDRCRHGTLSFPHTSGVSALYRYESPQQERRGDEEGPVQEGGVRLR
jgi:hypothetical protein